MSLNLRFFFPIAFLIFPLWGKAQSVSADTVLAERFAGIPVVKYSYFPPADTALTATHFNQGILTSPMALVQGRLPSVWVLPTGTEPTRSYTLLIRGVGSFDGATQPLYVVNGVPGVDPTLVAPADVTRLTVLTDPVLLAQWGSRGANGVVLIDTNPTLATGFRFTYQTTVGVQQRSRWAEMMSAADFRAKLPASQKRYDLGGNTDWLAAISRQAVQQQHSLQATGQIRGLTVSGGINGLLAPGVIQHNQLDRLNTHLSVSNAADKRFFWQLSGYTRNDRQLPLDTDAFVLAQDALPTSPVYQADGTYTPFTTFNTRNPVAQLAQIEQTNRINAGQGQAYGRYTLTDQLQLDGRIAYTAQQLHTTYDDTPFIGAAGLIYQFTDKQNQQFGEINLRYHRLTPRKNTISLTVGAAWQQSRSTTNYKTPSILIPETSEDIWRMGSVLATGEWGAASGRFWLRGTARADWSARFGQQTVVVTPALSATYQVLRRATDAPDGLLLRMSYGLLANQASLLAANSPPLAANLTPERQRILQLSAEATALHGQLRGKLTLFDRQTRDAYWNDLTLSLDNSSTLTNRGRMNNRGIELTLQATLLNRDGWHWETTLTVAHLRNQIGGLGTGYRIVNAPVTGRGLAGQNTQLVQAGYSLYTFYGLGFAGISTDGKYRYQDVNNDGNISYETDRQTFGSALPRYQLGVTTSLSHGRWQLDALADGFFGHNLLNVTQLNIGNLLRYPFNNVSVIGVAQGLNDYPAFTSQWIQPGDFLRLNYLTLAYKLPVGRQHQLTVNLTAQNLLLWTRYSGPDPEAPLAAQPFGHDNRTLSPNARTVSAGVRFGW